MNIVRIKGYACGYYSNSEWEEEIYLLEDDYNKIKDLIKDLTINIVELDGKYSETEADIEIKIVKENELNKYSWSSNGKILAERINKKIYDAGYNIGELTDKADKVLLNVDGMVDINLTLNKSKLEKLYKCLDELKINY